MIITCPSCETRYQVDEAKFPPRGRTVRCAKCGNSWHQAGPEPETPPEPFATASEPISIPQPEATPEPAAAPEPEPAVRPAFGAGRAAYQPPPVSKPVRDTFLSHFRGPMLLPTLAVIGGWLGLIAVVLLIAVSAVRYRQDIAVIWPQSAGVYSGLGMKVSASGIDFRDVDYHREVEDGTVVLAVTGRIVNTSKRELPVPQTIRVTLSDANNHELYHWPFPSGVATLKAGQSMPFATRLSSPPIASRHLEVRFAKD